MKISTRLFGLALYCVVTASQAESWQDIHSTFSGFFQLDKTLYWLLEKASIQRGGERAAV